MNVRVSEFPITGVVSLFEKPNKALHHIGQKFAEYSGVPLHEVRLSGDPMQCVASTGVAPGMSLVAMTTDAGARSGERVGPCCLQVLSSSDGPAVLVPPGFGDTRWNLHKIILPQDGTPSMAAVVRPALQIAAGTGASLIVTSIISGKETPGEPGTLAMPRYIDQPQYEWPDWANELLERVQSLGSSPEALKLKFLMGHGEPSQGIVSAVAETHADLIIMGWRGNLGADRGNVFRKLLEIAPCPVLTARIRRRVVDTKAA